MMSKMIYFFCSEHLVGQGADLHEVLRKEVPGHMLQLVQSIDGLRQLLSAPGGDGQEILVIFLAGSSKELLLLQRLQDLLADRDLVLLVPDESEDVIALAHALYPRFLCCVHDDFTNVAQVIKKIKGSSRIAGGKRELTL